MTVDRRRFLGLAAGAALTLAAAPARAAGRVRIIDSMPASTPGDGDAPVFGSSAGLPIAPEARGLTFTMELEHAPFPHASEPYQDRTVVVFVPATFRVEAHGRVPMLVHFHGHHNTAERAIVTHQLREQLLDSKQNAILVVPQGPMNAADSSAGKLEAPGAFRRMLDEVLRTLASSEARHVLNGRRALEPGTLCLSAHSGGYHAAACCVRAGGVAINEVYLFDALYADLTPFRDWVIDGRGKSTRERHKLVSYYGAGATETNSQWLLTELEKAGVRCAYENVEGTLSREDLVRSEAVFIRTAIAHNGVTHELNALRDCLYASRLPRHQSTAWFNSKSGARTIERRR